MHILVIGASGRVGQRLTQSLLDADHQVIGTTRQEKTLFNSDNYRQIKLDLTAPLKEIEANIPAETDAIYFVSGSRGENLLQVDLHGAVKTMKAAEHKNINRYIMLSAIFSLQPEKWSSLIDYYTAKHYADLVLMESNLAYTILQPGMLTTDKGSGKIELGVEKAAENSIENVALTLAELLEQQQTYKKTIAMHDGNTPIAEAVANFS